MLDGIVHQIGDRPPHGRRPTGYRHVARSRKGRLLAGVDSILAAAFDQRAQIDQRVELVEHLLLILEAFGHFDAQAQPRQWYPKTVRHGRHHERAIFH
jgi:hypothetical protein